MVQPLTVTGLTLTFAAYFAVVHEVLSKPNGSKLFVAQQRWLENILVRGAEQTSEDILSKNGDANAIAPKIREPRITRQHKFDEKCRMDAIFLVDSSSSTRAVFPKQVDYVRHVIDRLNISDVDDHVAVIVFSGRSYNSVKHSLSDIQQKSIIQAKVDALPYLGGSTAAGAAFDRAYIELKNRRKDEHTVANVIIVSDGFSYDTVDKQSEAIHALQGVRIFAVAIANASKVEMKRMAGSDDNMYYGFDSSAELTPHLQECNSGKSPLKPVPSGPNDLNEGEYSTSNQKGDNEERENNKLNKSTSKNSKNKINGSKSSVEWSTLPSVVLRNASMKWTTHKFDESSESSEASGSFSEETTVSPITLQMKVSSNYLLVKEQRPLDVIIMLDNSGSINKRFYVQLELFNYLLNTLITMSSAHVGIVKFGGINRTRVLFPLNGSLNREIKDRLLTRQQMLGGVTYAKEALKKTVAELESSARKDPIKVVVVFSDGFIQDEIDSEIDALHATNAKIYAVAIAEYINRSMLTTITENAERIYTEKNFESLIDTIKSLQS